MRLTTFVLATTLTSLALGCDNEPGKGKERATVAAPVAEKTEQATTASLKGAAKVATQTYLFSQEGSTFGFVGAKVTGKHTGTFSDFKGSLLVPGGKPEAGKISATIQVASVSSDAAKLTGHLKSPDFFDVEKFPTASFKSTSIKAGGTGSATHTVTGNLELHGITKSITFAATIKLADKNATFAAEFVIDRKDFGIVYPGKTDDLIKDDVLMQLDLKGSAK